MTEGGARAEQIPGLETADPADAGRREDAAESAGDTREPGSGRGRARRPKRRTPAKRPEPAAVLPVARVIVDVPLAHLDRPFDYLVPAPMAEDAVPGCRVRVRFAGQLVDGYLLERVGESDHGGRLAFLQRVVSPEPVLAPEIAVLAREVADRYAGTLADVLRLAIPPRRAAVEAESSAVEAEPPPAGGGRPAVPSPRSPVPRDPPPVARDRSSDEPSAAEDLPSTAEGPDRRATGSGERAASGVTTMATEPPRRSEPSESRRPPHAPEPPGDADPWAAYPAGHSFLTALTDGRAPRAVWTALPGPDWPDAVAHAVRATVLGGRGALVVVPDARDVARLDAALTTALADAGGAGHVTLTAGLGPAERYRRWLSVRRGAVQAVVGTRAAMFAPVARLGLVVLWDDGDDLHAEPHAPYPHAREVLALRAHRVGAGALIGGFARTTEATQLVEGGWAHPLAADRATVRRRAPRVRAAGDDAELARDQAARSARLPYEAFRVARTGLQDGPVLIQVPRRGYLPATACARCRAAARCGGCAGPLALVSSHARPHCRWCGRRATTWRCAECGGDRLRAVVVGARRTAEELGRAFPSVPVHTSGRDGVLERVGGRPALVVATPGAEPLADEGYAAALLLDGWALLGRADLRAAEEAVRRWMNAAALVRPGPDGGTVVLLADSPLPPVQALVRWDPITLAERELAERAEVGFPPAVRMASLTAGAAALRDVLEALELPEGAQVLGPVPIEGTGGGPENAGGSAAATGRERALARVPRGAGLALARALKAAQGARSARKAPDPVRIQVDPLELI